MNEQLIVLEAILPNPWQPRENEDLEHIKSLALDIAAHGLLQTPVGRLVDDGQSVQLAFGHSRLAAYRWLNDVQNNSNLEGDWSRMPVIIQELSDEQMFEMALSENIQRRDLTPIEVAKAMARYRDEFGKTSGEIGAMFGLSDSAVRNKIRLLTLPADVQKAMAENGISERAARALLTLFDLPEDVRKRAEQTVWQDKPSEIVRQTLDGISSDAISEKIDRMVRSIGKGMHLSLFKHSERFEGDAYRSPDCQSCPLRIVQKENVYCLDGECYQQKQTVCRSAYLSQASAVCNIPVGDASLEETYSLEKLYVSDRSQKLMEIGCENLRLAWRSSDGKGLIKGYPHAEVYCLKSRGRCTCQHALDSGVLKGAAPIVTVAEKVAPANGKSLIEVFGDEMTETESVQAGTQPLPATEPDQQKRLTAEDLKEIDREIRRKKRQALEECKAIREDAIREIHSALIAHNPVIWWEHVQRELSWQKREKMEDLPFDEIMLILAETIAIRVYDWQYGEPDEKVALERYNRLFKVAGLPGLSGVSTETEKSE